MAGPPYRFGTASRRRLATVDARLATVFETAIEVVDITILEGIRSEQRQDELFRMGMSKVKWPDGKHNAVEASGLSLAVDFAPWPIDWKDLDRFRAIAFYLRGIGEAQGRKIRLGADWDGDFSFKDQTFHDVGHVELLV